MNSLKSSCVLILLTLHLCLLSRSHFHVVQDAVPSLVVEEDLLACDEEEHSSEAAAPSESSSCPNENVVTAAKHNEIARRRQDDVVIVKVVVRGCEINTSSSSASIVSIIYRYSVPYSVFTETEPISVVGSPRMYVVE